MLHPNGRFDYGCTVGELVIKHATVATSDFLPESSSSARLCASCLRPAVRDHVHDTQHTAAAVALETHWPHELDDAPPWAHPTSHQGQFPRVTHLPQLKVHRLLDFTTDLAAALLVLPPRPTFSQAPRPWHHQ